jgi:methyl-accepting chemotaxis protein
MPEGEIESYEIVPVTPLKKLEKRIERLEQSGTIPQLQALINQIIELIRSNQKIVNDVIQANTELRNEISRLPSKLDDLITTMKSFISLVEAAGKEEISTPTESLKPISEQLQKMIEQNQKLLESNQAILEQLDSMNRKLKGGTPVSHLLASYPRLKLRKEVR